MIHGCGRVHTRSISSPKGEKVPTLLMKFFHLWTAHEWGERESSSIWIFTPNGWAHRE
jgi:hypothetical protein